MYWGAIRHRCPQALVGTFGRYRREGGRCDALLGTASAVLLVSIACAVASEAPAPTDSAEQARQPSRQDVAAGQNHGQAHVVLLGTGTPDANPDRFGPSVAVVVNDASYLVDLGAGVVRRAAAAASRGIWSLDVLSLNRAFITHLHSDHMLGYPDFLLSPWVVGRVGHVEVYGPEGLQAMTDHILAAYSRDIEVRVSGLESADDIGYRPIVREIEPGLIYEDDNVRVEAFAVNHGSWPQAFGYKFITPQKTIVISGDTAPSESVVEACDGCDILVHEVYSLEGFQLRPDDWRAYHSTFHTSTVELAELASRARPRLLVLYHQLFWGASDEELVLEIKRGYDGEVVSGRDLDVY